MRIGAFARILPCCFAASALLVAPAPAEVTSTGLVTPSNVVSDPIQAGAELRIGVGNDPEDVDPRASVTVDNTGADTLLDFNQIYVGYDEGFFGRMSVTGAGAKVILHDGGAHTDAALEIGREGNGYFEIKDGATLDLEGSGGDIVIGQVDGAIGEMLATGASTFVDLEGDIIVGDAGAGSMTISGGALVRTTDTDSLVSIGDEATGTGVLVVDGHLTTLQAGHNLTVGNAGIGELHITGDALIDADNTSTAVAAIGALGSIRMNSGTLDTRVLTVDGYLGGHGTVRGVVTVNGDVETGAGQRLDFEDPVANSGAITITNGELRFQDAATTTATGRLTLEDGVVRYSQAHTNNGVIASAEGTNNLHGAISNAVGATVVVASESVAVFNDTYTDAGTTTVLSRGNALFLANATFTSTALVSLTLDAINGTNVASQIEVAGLLNIENASLALNFSPGFDLSTSQAIELLHADGGLSGAFVPPVFPNVQGVNFGIVYGANSVLLDIVVDPNAVNPGDFNGDGVVDAADYTVWRDGLGTQYSQADYTEWRSSYGQVYAPPAFSSVPAPEPAALVLVAGILAAAATARRRDLC